MNKNVSLKKRIPSVNFHLWEPCNMSCKYCFASFQDVKQTVLPNGHLSREEAFSIVKELANIGFEKITFAGGEPTLCPWLSDLIVLAKKRGMTTMLVTNGSRLNEDFLKSNIQFLDWIAISIDSIRDTTNSSIGRTLTGQKPYSMADYLFLIDRIKFYGYELKINTVVSKHNYKESMVDFICKATPKRWKVLQVLPIKGQNDEGIQEMAITDSEFQIFVNNHKSINCMIPENNTAMRSSYVMLDPAGRFFNNADQTHKYSQPILEVGATRALNEMNYDYSKFVARKGIYNWK